LSGCETASQNKQRKETINENNPGKLSPAFKAKVALEALSGEKTIAEITSRMRFIPIK
jgi:hypothetical protein